MPRIGSFRNWGCLVTGASSGIGREIALLLAEQGARLVLVGRRRERLEEAAAEALRLGAPLAIVLPADLENEGEADRVAGAATAALDGVDLLVNNAGFAAAGVFHLTDIDLIERMIRLNVLAAARLMRLLLPPMLARDRGGVLTVASISGFQAAPFQGAYGGTKAFLLNLSDSVHQEIKPANVAITALCPGPTDTEFFEVAGYREFSGFLARRAVARTVAQAGLRGLARGRMEVVPGWREKGVVFFQRFLPRTWVAAASRRVLATRPTPRPAPRGPTDGS